MADGGMMAGFLGVSRSLSGRAWTQRAADSAMVRQHQLKHGLSEPLARSMSRKDDGSGNKAFRVGLR